MTQVYSMNIMARQAMYIIDTGLFYDYYGQESLE